MSLQCLQVIVLYNKSGNGVKSFFTNSLGHDYDISSNRDIKHKCQNKAKIRKYAVCFYVRSWVCFFLSPTDAPSPPKWNSSRSAQINKKAVTSTLSMIAVENDKIAPADEESHPCLIVQMKVEMYKSTRWCGPNPDSPLICHDKSSAAANLQRSPLH